MSKTNTGLLKYAKVQVGNPYWFGTYGQTASEALYKAQKKQYPAYYKATDFASQYGKRVHDCSGLYKGYMMSASATATPKYNSKYDMSAAGLYAKASTKGKYGSIPNAEGILVYKGSSPSAIHHVGVYDGNGYVYEAKGHAYGTVKSKYGSSWTYWSYAPYVTYETETETESKYTGEVPTLPKRGFYQLYDGIKGTFKYKGYTNVYTDNDRKQIKLIQSFLKWYGVYTKGIDGKYGNATSLAVNKFEKAMKLTVDGQFGKQCLAKMKACM